MAFTLSCAPHSEQNLAAAIVRLPLGAFLARLCDSSSPRKPIEQQYKPNPALVEARSFAAEVAASFCLFPFAWSL
jgi:hypothetical protein